MSAIESKALYTVVDPNGNSWMVSILGGYVTYNLPWSALYLWDDEDTIVEGIESGKVNDPEWLMAHDKDMP